MTQDNPERNTQSGVVLPPAADADPPAVAHGNRREAVHYEADPDQLVRVRHTLAPDDALPPDIPSAQANEPDRFTTARVTDITVVPLSPSAWEAVADDEDAAAR